MGREKRSGGGGDSTRVSLRCRQEFLRACNNVPQTGSRCNQSGTQEKRHQILKRCAIKFSAVMWGGGVRIGGWPAASESTKCANPGRRGRQDKGLPDSCHRAMAHSRMENIICSAIVTALVGTTLFLFLLYSAILTWKSLFITTQILAIVSISSGEIDFCSKWGSKRGEERIG